MHDRASLNASVVEARRSAVLRRSLALSLFAFACAEAPAPRVATAPSARDARAPVRFAIDVDPSAKSARVTIYGAASAARGLSVEANLIQDGFPGSGPVDSFELVTTNVRLPLELDCGAGENCFDVTLSSFYDTESFTDLYMMLDSITPSTGRAILAPDPPPPGSNLAASVFGGRNFGDLGPGANALREIRVSIPSLEPYRVEGRLFHDAVGAPAACPVVASCRMFIGNAFAPRIHTIEPFTGVLTSTITVTLAGFTVFGITAMDSHPISGELYAAIKVSNTTRTNRVVAIIDKATGVATALSGALAGGGVAGLAFNTDGTILWATIGERGADPMTLKQVDLGTGVLGPVLATFGNGTDGEAIGFNHYDGLIYHASGFTDGDRFFETVDPNAGFAMNVITSDLATPQDEVLGLAFDPDTGRFFATGLQTTMYSIGTDASVTPLSTYPLRVYRGPTLSP